MFDRNLRFLTDLGIEHSSFLITDTGLNKGILDAVYEVRTHFALEGFHHYSGQGRGEKSVTRCTLLDDSRVLGSRFSLYRAKERGDPRMWITDIGLFGRGGDWFVFIFYEKNPYVINISQLDLEVSYHTNGSEVGRLLHEIFTSLKATSDELLHILRDIAKAPIFAVQRGDTAVGMAVERALGLPPNARKTPDYKGIELKSSRALGSNRNGIFTQVPNWGLSSVPRMAEFVEQYGYERDGNSWQLNCTVTAHHVNPQGLSLGVDFTNDLLIEYFNPLAGGSQPVLVWEGGALRAALEEKHAETFWIRAEVVWIDGVEHFWLEDVVHTRKPMLSQFMPLIDQRVISLDHMVKRMFGSNTAKERGPAFKIHPSKRDLLFPNGILHRLR